RVVPHFMQKRRVGAFEVPQFGQILGGRISPSGSLLPHFMQNWRDGLLAVPQFVHTRRASGASVVAGVGGVAPGTTPSSSAPTGVVVVAVVSVPEAGSPAAVV